MACSNVGCLCPHMVFSESVTFTAPDLIVNLPDQADTTIAANVVITIGDEDTQYPLVNSNCTNVSACQIASRTRYATRVHTNIQSGVFKLLTNLNCCNCRCSSNAAESLPIPAAPTTTNTTGGEG